MCIRDRYVLATNAEAFGEDAGLELGDLEGDLKTAYNHYCSKKSHQDRTLEMKKKYEVKNRAAQSKNQRTVNKAKRMATMAKQGREKKKSTHTGDIKKPRVETAKHKGGEQTRGPTPLVSDPNPNMKHNSADHGPDLEKEENRKESTGKEKVDDTQNQG